jgi:hypothetical protein
MMDKQSFAFSIMLETEIITAGHQGDQKNRKKLPKFSKNSPKSCQVKKVKISTANLNLKVQNIYIKPLLKP